MELDRQGLRAVAKAGLVSSLAVLLVTGFSGKKTLHVAAGVALIATSLWHVTLYRRFFKSVRLRPLRDDAEAAEVSSPA